MISADSLDIVRQALKSGNSDQALALVKGRETKSIVDCDRHVAWAEILEELELPDEAIYELNLAIRDDPQREDLYPRLAEIYLDQGKPERAARVWQSLVKIRPDNPENYKGWAEALRAAKQPEKARQVYESGLKKTGDNRFKALIRELGFLHEEDDLEEATSEDDYVLPQSHQIMNFISLFSGREGVYARQWLSPTGESGYVPVEEPLTQKVVENHLAGNYTIGVYPVRLDNSVGFIAFDIDVAKFALASAVSSSRLWSSLMTKVHQTASRITEYLADFDVTGYVEDSGFKGRHVWIFLESPIAAGVAKKFGETLINQIAPFPNEVTVEVFPKQASVKKGGLGNLIKLPLGIHKRTGKRGLFLEPDATPAGDQWMFLDKVKKSSRRSIFAFIQRMHAHLEPVNKETTDDVPFDRESPTQPQFPVKPVLEYNPEMDPQLQHLLHKCSTIRNIIENLNRSGMIDNNETLALIHTVGHLENGASAVNHYLQKALNCDPALLLKSNLKGNPMSCAKIKAKLPQARKDSSCGCIFETGSNLYPSPVIHINSMSVRNSSVQPGLTLQSLQFQNLLQDYLKLRKQMRETAILLEQYEKRLESFFTEAQVEAIDTPTGKLSISRIDGKVRFNLEI